MCILSIHYTVRYMINTVRWPWQSLTTRIYTQNYKTSALAFIILWEFYHFMHKTPSYLLILSKNFWYSIIFHLDNPNLFYVLYQTLSEYTSIKPFRCLNRDSSVQYSIISLLNQTLILCVRQIPICVIRLRASEWFDTW